MGTQLGYGVNDTVGSPALYLATAAGVVTGSTINMVGTDLLLNAGVTTAALTIVLPQNPVDGAVATISSTGTITALTVSAATSYAPTGLPVNQSGTVSDVIAPGTLGTLTTLVPVAATTTGSSVNTVKFKYTLNGYINFQTGVVTNARTWVRVQ